MDILRKKTSILYSSHGEEPNKDDESRLSLLNSETSPPPPKHRVWPFVLPWIVSTIAFAWAAGFFFLKSLPPVQFQEHSFSTGWKTDFGKLSALDQRNCQLIVLPKTGPARSAIALEEVRFTGGPMYSENGTYYVPHPAAINYTADPSPELDAAWEELTWGRTTRKTIHRDTDSL